MKPYDGIYEAARRDYRDCNRSWHIPKEEKNNAIFWAVAGFCLFVAFCATCALAGLS